MYVRNYVEGGQSRRETEAEAIAEEAGAERERFWRRREGKREERSVRGRSEQQLDDKGVSCVFAGWPPNRIAGSQNNYMCICACIHHISSQLHACMGHPLLAFATQQWSIVLHTVRETAPIYFINPNPCIPCLLVPSWLWRTISYIIVFINRKNC